MKINEANIAKQSGENNTNKLTLFISIFNFFSSRKKKDKIKGKERKINHVYDVDKSLEFYTKIAHKYDERESRARHETHTKIIQEVGDIINSTKDKCYVLDIGAGTGKLVAHHFITNKNLEWWNLDISQEMLNQYDENLSTARFERKQIIGDIQNLSKCVALNEKQGYFDLIVVSFVLSSLKKLPDFSYMISLMKENGKIIIANIDPELTKEKPLYDFKIKNETIALNTIPVYPLDITSIFMKQGLQPILLEPINNQNNERYANILIFQKVSKENSTMYPTSPTSDLVKLLAENKMQKMMRSKV